MSQKRSAEFYRGAVAALNRAQRDFTVTVPELQAEYVDLLAEAESREASVPTESPTLTETIAGLREACAGVVVSKHEEITAAEVIAAAEKALDTFARAYRISMEPFGLQIDQADGASHWMPGAWPTVGEFKVANDAIAAIAKWKEAQ